MQVRSNSKVAIIGCGLVGGKRAEGLPGGLLLYACDLDLARAHAIASRYEGCIATTDVEQVLTDPSVLAVIVALPHVLLAPITLRAVRYGKHTLVEKPGGISVRQLDEVIIAANENKALVRVGYNHRYHPAFQRTYELIQSGDVGELMFIRGRYGHGGRTGYDREWRADPKLSGGGELIDQGVHLIDLAGSFMGEFVTIDGHATTYFWDMQVDDNAFLSLRTTRGQTAWLQVSCTEWKNLFSFEIYFKRAKFHIEGLGGNYGVERLYYYKMLSGMGPPETVIYEYPREDISWALELDQFFEDIRLDRRPNPGLEEAKRTLEIVERIYQKSGYLSTD
jgi:predicted dehydrogenase